MRGSWLGGLLLACGLAGAQEPASAGFTYEVVAIKPNTSGSGNMLINTNNDSYQGSNVDLKGMIQNAFRLQTAEQVAGLPSWANGAHYDVNAKLDADTAARLKALKPEERSKAEDELMRSMLVERFGLKFHHEQREQPEYALVQAKGGSKLKASDAANPKNGNMQVNNGKMEAWGAQIEQLAYFLSYQAHRHVEDKTGLTGKYDLALVWTRDDMMKAGDDGTTERAPGLFTAIQEQMGLKLEPTKGAVDTVVVDHIDQPTEN